MTIPGPIKQIVRSGFSLFNLEIRRAQKHGCAAPDPMKGANVLALAISDVLLRRAVNGKNYPEFTFVQIGANDGLTVDPIRRFILKYGFRGVLVEPQPDVFQKLKSNYSGAQNLQFANVAIARTSGTVSMYRFKNANADWADCLATFSRETLLNNFHNVKGEVEELKIPAVTLPQLLETHGLKKLDLLQIDAEGYDYEIIKAMGETSIRPEIIAFEPGFLSISDQVECFAFLNSLGYAVNNNGPDTVAYREPADQSLFRIDVQAT